MRLSRLPRLPITRLTVLLGVFTLAVALPAAAQRGDDASRKSKNGKTEATIGGVAVTVEYGRPQVRGREVWGSLVPYGKVWRTGADEATTITFAKDVTVEGKPLAAGTYSLFTIPGEKEWQVVFNKTAQQWGAFEYDEKQDALRVTVKPESGDGVEVLDFVADGDRIVLRWEKVRVGFRVAPAG